MLGIDIGAIIQVVTGGLLLGALWGMVALGLNLIFGVMRVINLAHGEFLMFGAFLTLELYNIGVPPFLSAFLLLPVFFLIGVAVQYTVIDRILQTSDAELISLLATFALLLIFQNIGRAIWSTDPRAIQGEFISQTTQIFGIGISYARIFTLVVAFSSMVALYLITTRTQFGLSMQATVQNSQMAKVAGIDTNRVYYITFGISAALAGLAGSMVSMIYPFTSSIGFSYLIMGFLVVIFGGLGSFVGALLGALILGIVGSAGGYLFGPGIRDVILLLILIVTLFIRPSGIFGGARV